MMSTTSLAPNFVRTATLDNGILLLVVENPAADLIAGRIFLKHSGSRWEEPAQAGLFHLLAATLMKGTNHRSALDIAEASESVGASLGCSTTNDYFALSLKTITQDFAAMLALAAEILREPSFPEGEVALEKRLTLQNLRSQLEQPFNLAYQQLRQGLFPEHPYGLSVFGSEDTLPNLTPDRLHQCHQRFFRPDNLIMSLSGRITLDEAIALVQKQFGDWAIPPEPLPSLHLDPVAPQPGWHRTSRDSQQSIVMLGYLVPSVYDPDYAPLKLISTYLGNGLSSRLFVELREKRGLAYDVSAIYPTRMHESHFLTYMGTAPDNTRIAVEGLAQEVERLRQSPLTPQDLQIAKNKLLGQYALGKQTNGELAQTYGWYEVLGLGTAFDQHFPQMVQEVTVEDVQRVAQSHLGQPQVSLVGPETVLPAVLPLH